LEHVPAPEAHEGELQMQITSLDYSKFLGRIAVGKVTRGVIKEGDWVALAKPDGSSKKQKVKEIYTFSGLGKVKATEVKAGDICAVVGIDGFQIGDTIADAENPEALPVMHIDEPTMNMSFGINNSPFFGKDGKFVTSRHLVERLEDELERNLALRVEPTSDSNTQLVYGRGIMHLSVLIETMRREGYELTVGQPQVIFKEIDGVKCEPYETLVIDVPDDYSSKAIDLVTQRKGDLLVMEAKEGMQHLEFEIPSRGLIGLRSLMLTSTAGEAVMAHNFLDYKPFKGAIAGRSAGVIISKDQGVSTPYSIDKLQDRGKFFIEPGEEVYEGMIVGEHSRNNDLVVNVIEAKKLNNIRAAGKDDSSSIAPKTEMTLEECMEYIQADECIEVTPNFIRLRKIHLKEVDRKRFEKSMS
ncbi:EF-Tu/IF-2/RF-3 family GTPase, partial [Empedobacter sp.]|uniref:EF-Tu/IF-2/RF-3 family GTPase n=1 Tax=Empedobacter sp. TaxID=1927715 RepID=UPI0028B26638